VEERGYFLIDIHELDIAKLVAHRSPPEADMEFIYIEARAVCPSGIYTFTESDLARRVAEWGFAHEEVGYYKERYISRAEYDDGYARLDGEVLHVGEEAEVRLRYLTPYNLLIAPFDSRINNRSIDSRVKESLNEILTGMSTLQDVVDLLRRTPKGKRY
jgi:hypothetical protein